MMYYEMMAQQQARDKSTMTQNLNVKCDNNITIFATLQQHICAALCKLCCFLFIKNTTEYQDSYSGDIRYFQGSVTLRTGRSVIQNNHQNVTSPPRFLPILWITTLPLLPSLHPSMRLMAHEECVDLRGTSSSVSIKLSSLLCIYMCVCLCAY